MIRFAVAAGLAFAALPAQATELPPVHCGSDEKTWFSGYSKELDTVISFCGSQTMEGAQAWLQLRYGEVGGSLVYHPPLNSDWRSAFQFSRYTRPRVTYLTLETEVDGIRYKVFDSYDADDPAVTGGSLTVTFADGGESSHALVMTTEPLTIFGLEDQVVTKPFLE